ncbi:MAG: hypothetical protein IIU25_04285 [Oscillospiraceae bacterium]|nr:hypothetical protein [Oscillospiraceae bacterium]
MLGPKSVDLKKRTVYIDNKELRSLSPGYDFEQFRLKWNKTVSGEEHDEAFEAEYIKPFANCRDAFRHYLDKNCEKTGKDLII